LLLGLTAADIVNKKVVRDVRLDIPGSNLVRFENEIEFTKEASDNHYYYTIAQDYEWSFVALKVEFKDDSNTIQELPFERV
jgi:oligosaccharyltransferase complex subunit alpha (ribophorin I)